MKLLNLKQNTPEWEKFRQSKIGASDVPILMMGTDSEIEHLWKRKLGLENPIFQSPSMKRGGSLEETARTLYSEKGIPFVAAVGQHDDHPFLISSFDGINEKHRMCLEIKCPTRPTYETCELFGYKRYLWQVQAQLLVSGFSMGILYSYHPEKVCEEWISPNPEMQGKIIEQAKWFYLCMQEKINPREIVQIEDPELEKEILEAKYLEKKAKEILEKSKEELLKRTDGRSCRCGDITLSKTEETVRTNYKKAAIAAGIDLTNYQTEVPSSFRWSFKS